MSMTEAIAVLLLGICLIFRSVQKVYANVPTRELRRRAAKGDETSHAIYQAARFEHATAYLLELLISAGVAGLAYILFSNASASWAILLTAGLIIYLFAIKPSTKSANISEKLAVKMAAPIATTLKYISPLVNILSPRKFGLPRYPKIYDPEDLIKFLNEQKKVSESRIPSVDIERAIAALEHTEIYVKDEMIPKKNMRLLKLDEPVGPILLSELYETGQDCFAVKEDDSERIIGSVSIGELTEAKEGGTIAEFTNKKVVYVNENWLIGQAINAYQASGQSVFMVTNRKQKVVGIISFAKLLEKLVGPADKSKTLKYINIDSVAAN
jgi:CBS domain containing-hemolysin-like protein